VQKVFVFLLCVFLYGCVTIEETTSAYSFVSEKKPEEEFGRKFLSTRQALEGMTKKEVESVLGKEVLVGYELTQRESGQYKPITLENPYRTEPLQKAKKSYQVDYYLVGIAQPDNVVSDNELVPLVFLDDKLIGKGWGFLNNIKK